MSKEKWNKCPLTGVSEKKLRLSDYANFRGEFKAELFKDCTLFDVSSIAHAAGYGRVDNFKRALLTDTSSSMHLIPIITDDRRTLTYCMAVNSAQQGGAGKTLEIQVRNARR